MPERSLTSGRTQAPGDAEQVLDRLLALIADLGGALAEVSARYDLTPQQALLLRFLHDPRPMNSLAHELRCDPSNVTGLIDRIEHRGLVERAPSPRDRRIRLLTLTDEGRRVRGSIQRELVEAAVLMRLPGAGLGQILRLLGQLTGGMRPRSSPG